MQTAKKSLDTAASLTPSKGSRKVNIQGVRSDAFMDFLETFMPVYTEKNEMKTGASLSRPEPRRRVEGGPESTPRMVILQKIEPHKIRDS